MTTATAPVKTKSLFDALAKAQAAARPVEKDGRNKFHNYNYVSAEAMIADAKEILAAHGLGIMPVRSDLLPNPGLTIMVSTKQDGPKEYSAAGLLASTWLVIHGESGETHEISGSWPIVPESGRPLDKATAAARTASLSYLLRDLLQLPRVEEGTGLDDDRRSRDEEHHDQRGAQQRARPTNGPPAGRLSPPPPSTTKPNEPSADEAEKIDKPSQAAEKPASAAGESAPAAEAAGGGKKRSATSILLEFRKVVLACPNEKVLDATIASWKTTLERLSARPRAIAEAFARTRGCELAGVNIAEADAALATQLNDMAKE